MAIEGLHHITAITADAPRNVDFYARLLGLRLVKKTVNFDQPDVYHLYFGDERGAPGSILTFFEFPGAAAGRAGDGMVHTVLWRVASEDALSFWAHRLGDAGVAVEREEGLLRLADPEGLAHELVAVAVADAPLAATAPDVPPEHALLGFHGVRAHGSRPERSAPLLEALGLTGGPATWQAQGAERHAVLALDAPPAEAGVQGAGTVHHIAWSVADDAELTAVRERATGAGAHATPIIDRQYFHSVYFREPGGVLFELASRDIGFDVDEPADTLGESLRLPPQYEARRAELERRLTPLANPRGVSVLAHELRPAAGDPEGALVLLHGRGADEHDLAPLLDVLDPARRLVGVTPGGPLQLPPGGRHWYVVPRVGFPDPDTFAASYGLLERELPALTGVPWERTILGGFSQGTVMAYALALGAGRPTPAGVVALSGFIPTVDGWTADLDRAGLEAFVAHGRRDPVISVDFARDARARLEAAGVPVVYHEGDGGHQLDPRAVADLPGWVARRVDAL